MKYTLKCILFLPLFIMGCDDNAITSPSENLISVPILKIYMNPDDLVNLRSNKTNNFEAPARLFYGSEVVTGLMRASGSGSRYHAKWAYKITLLPGQTIENLNVFNLSAQTFDPTQIKTNLALHLYSQLGLLTHESRHIFLNINDKDQGLYPLIERVDEDFLLKRNTPVFEMYKLSFEAKFSFNELNNPQFNFDKEIPDDDNYSSLFEFIHARDTSNTNTILESYGKFLDIENYIKYHAMTSLMNNFDAFTNNYFLIKENPTSPFKIIPWDFDKCFSSPVTAGLAGDNGIISKLLEADTTFNMYKAELEHQVNNLFTNINLDPIIDSTAAVIRDAYNLDPYLGVGRYNFEDEINKLKSYIAIRRQHVIDTLPLFIKDNPGL